MTHEQHTDAAMKLLGIEPSKSTFTVGPDLSTREARIRYGAFVWTASYPNNSRLRLKEKGLADDEILEAIALHDLWENEHHGWVAYYGRPEYGGWVRDKRDNRHKPHQLVPQEFQG